MPLTKDRFTKEKPGAQRAFPVKAGEVIYFGALVAVDANGYLVAGKAATGLKGVGRAESFVDNSAGADGDVSVTVRVGIFNWNNSADADEISNADIGATVYIVDDETVAKTDGTGTRSAAGKVYEVDTDGVWVKAE